MNAITSSYLRRGTALLLVAVLSAATLPSSLASDSDAGITGQVVSSGTLTPLEGARVHVADPHTGEIHTSGATDASGRFAISGLAATTYEVGVENDGYLFVVNSPAVIAPGQTREVYVAVDQNAAMNAQSSAAAQAQQKKSSGLKPLYGALIVVGGAFLIGFLLDDSGDDEPASPSLPSS
jgi:hypothetical protein